jgi:Single Cache domain 2
MMSEAGRLCLGRDNLKIVAPHFAGASPLSVRFFERAHVQSREDSMMRGFMIAATSTAILMLSPTAFAEGQFGTADEAHAMLTKAVAAVKADQVVALAMFNKGEGGFKDRDLYPFCFRIADGKTVAGPISVPAGTDVRTLRDSAGKVYGPELFTAAQKPEGQITIVDYMFPKPGTTAPTFPKSSFVTKVGDLGCGVGYYKG